ncbi:hypothetical protein ACJ72_04476 [Emergomyces africanus]|uniref:SET domain-containing protein n=1 Tax=Emergomyces africanus TaxID=1955775 RepID=A0A1B7NWN3_9EURO|nr:hypothetical protein ACJ72_04476 [Emergomyces africanus]
MSNSCHFGEGDKFSQESDEFMSWLRQSSGVRVSQKIKIADLRSESAGRGIVACNDIKEDEELFAIPQGLVLSFQNSKLKGLLDINESDLGPWLCLILVMIFEYLQGGASPWSQYFQVLPTNFDTLMFWTDAELQELKGSAVLNKIGKREAEETILLKILPIISSNPHLFPPASNLSSYNSPEGKNVLLSLAHRMGSLIMAYAFDIEKGEDEEKEGQDGYVTDDEEQQLPKGMVPLADLLNADADRNNVSSSTLRGIILRTSIRCGEEIFNDYGELPRSDLLRRYGYVTENYARYDEVEVSMHTICRVAGLESATPGQNQPRLDFLEDLGVFEDSYSIQRLNPAAPLTEVLPEELLIVLNILTMPLEQFNQLKMKNKAPKPNLGIAEATLLVQAVQQTLDEYTTTLDMDEKLLASFPSIQGPTNSSVSARRYKMALQVRKGEKEILSQLLATVGEFVTHQDHLPDANTAMKRSTESLVGSREKRRRL